MHAIQVAANVLPIWHATTLQTQTQQAQEALPARRCNNALANRLRRYSRGCIQQIGPVRPGENSPSYLQNPVCKGLQGLLDLFVGRLYQEEPQGYVKPNVKSKSNAANLSVTDVLDCKCMQMEYAGNAEVTFGWDSSPFEV